jgi:hypothetical protein
MMFKVLSVCALASPVLGSASIPHSGEQKEDSYVLIAGQDSDNKFFEITIGGDHSCDPSKGDGGKVVGYEVGRCEDYVATSGDNSWGQAESRMLREPGNDGFPIWQRFRDHGCKGDSVGDDWRMKKNHVADFPVGYKPGNNRLDISMHIER